MKLISDGYEIIKDIFLDSEIQSMRNIALSYFRNGNGFRNAGGIAKPDWIKDPFLQDIKFIIESKNFEKIIEDRIGEPVKFISHNDLHLNR